MSTQPVAAYDARIHRPAGQSCTVSFSSTDTGTYAEAALSVGVVRTYD